ncbi:MFS transporter [Pelagicoccus mobilis]|uniref:MFS transporter n=1 Tax=Pelagicoccus mobilis TaxID=415221 RepID=A0A934S0J9_9BACT|nr:MFS transporter [Pelagicoccus mobilis]MBK1878341.1 MFS transporter [Pelagicoccus mobilis]
MSTQLSSQTEETVNSPSDRVPLPQKFGFGLGSFVDMWGQWLYNSLAFQVFNIFLGINPGLVSTVLMINRLWDAVTDPLFGWLSDNTRSRFGRRRPFILIAGLLAGVGLPLLYAVGEGWSSHQYFLYMILSSGVYICITSAFMMPYASLGMEMTPNYNERTLLMGVRNAIQKAPELAMFFAGQFTTLAVWDGANMTNLSERLFLLFTSSDAWAKGKGENILLGAQVYTTILGAIMVLCAILMFVLLRERYYKNVVERKQKKVKIIETIYQALSCKPFRNLLFMVLAYAIGTSMVGALGYYNTIYYVCQGDLGLGAAWNFKMGIAGMVFGFLGIPFYTTISKKWGKRHAMALVLIMAIMAFIGDWWLYNPNLPWLQIFATGFVAFTGAGFWTLYNSLLPDVIDYDELESGKRREGAFSACQSWIMKVGLALGAGASGWILAATGFDSELGGNQPAEAIFWIRFLLSSVPVIFLLGALFALYKFPLTRENMATLRSELEAIRGKV